MSDVTPCSREDAAEALRAAAFTTDESDDAKLRELARWLASMDDLEDPVARAERRSVTLTAIIERARDALGTPRQVIHCLLGGLGADHDLEQALKNVRFADQIAWHPHPLGRHHDLAVQVGPHVYRYAVRIPEGLGG